MSWTTHPIAATARSGIEGDPELVRLTLDDGAVVNLRNPTIQNDSVYGLIVGRQPGERIAFPVSRVRRLEHGQVHAWRTAALLVGIGVAAAVTYIVIALQSLGDNY
jgi:hypothetical protein